MQHKPRPANHIEKQLGEGGISGDLQGESNSVSQVNGFSDMAPACQPVALWEEDLENGQCPLLALMPLQFLPVCHWCL